MSEKSIEDEFRKYKRKYINQLGNRALNNVEIDEFCSKLFKSKYRGCFAQDEIFKFAPGYYIFNTDVTSGPGIHWLGLFVTKKTAYIYDSFARDPEKIVPILTRRLKKQKLKIVSSDRSDAEQKSTNRGSLVVTCAHACISWLTCVDKFGIRKSIKI
jgi:hypothetical protein